MAYEDSTLSGITKQFGLTIRIDARDYDIGRPGRIMGLLLHLAGAEML